MGTGSYGAAFGMLDFQIVVLEVLKASSITPLNAQG